MNAWIAVLTAVTFAYILLPLVVLAFYRKLIPVLFCGVVHREFHRRYDKGGEVNLRCRIESLAQSVWSKKYNVDCEREELMRIKERGEYYDGERDRTEVFLRERLQNLAAAQRELDEAIGMALICGHGKVVEKISTNTIIRTGRGKTVGKMFTPEASGR